MSANAKALFEEGVRAYRAKDKAKARQLLKESLALEPQNDMVWLMYAKTQPTDEKQLQCVERALKINPTNELALELQYRLLKKMGYDEDDEAPEAATQPPAKPVAQARSTVDLMAVSPTNLGALRADVGMRFSVMMQRIAGFVLVLLPMLLLLGWQFRKDFVTWQYSGRVTNTFIPMGLLLLLFVGGGLHTLYSVLTSIGLRVRIYDNGVQYGSLLMGRKTYMWRDMDYLTYQDKIVIHRYHGIPIYKQVLYHVRPFKNGWRLLSISKAVGRFREVGEILISYAGRGISQRYMLEFKQNGSFKVGNIVVDRKGMKQGMTSLAWQEIGRIDVIDGGIYIEKRNGGQLNFKLRSFDGTILTGPIADAMIFAQKYVR